MKLSRERRALLSLLALGAVILLVDRLWLAEPHEAPAAVDAISARAAPAARSPAPAPSATAASAPGPAADLAARLARLAAEQGVDPTAVRDAFTPAESWMPRNAPPPLARAEDDAARSFIAAHQLHAVMGAGEHAVAIVNGQPLRVGTRINGYRLIEVRQRGALFAGPSGLVELRLPE